MQTKHAPLKLLALLVILTSCAYLTKQPASPAHDPSKVACESFRLITWQPGDENEATRLLGQVKDGSMPITRESLTVLREALGDTSGTIQEIKPHNAAYTALCAKPVVGPADLTDSAPLPVELLEARSR